METTIQTPAPAPTNGKATVDARTRAKAKVAVTLAHAKARASREALAPPTVATFLDGVAAEATAATKPTAQGMALAALLFGRVPTGPVAPDAKLLAAGVSTEAAMVGPVERRARKGAAVAVGALGAEALIARRPK